MSVLHGWDWIRRKTGNGRLGRMGPWKRLPPQAVGGCTEVGFAPETDLLLVVSSGGRGLFDCRLGERVGRDSADLSRWWYDEANLLAVGIGPLEGRFIPLAGLNGGRLPSTTSDGWSVRSQTSSAPAWTKLLISYRDGGERCFAEDYGFHAFGFSPTGLSLVIASGSDLEIYTRRPTTGGD